MGHDALADVCTVRDCVYGLSVSVPFCNHPYPIPQSFVKRVCNTVLGANYLQRVISAEKSLEQVLLRIAIYERNQSADVLDWESIFPFNRDAFLSSPQSALAYWLNFVEYNPLTLCWHLRTSYYNWRTYLMDNLHYIHPDLSKSGHSLESDIDYLKVHHDIDAFPLDNPLSIQQMDAFYCFQEQLPDIVQLINFKSYETKLKNRREYSHKVSISPNYV